LPDATGYIQTDEDDDDEEWMAAASSSPSTVTKHQNLWQCNPTQRNSLNEIYAAGRQAKGKKMDLNIDPRIVVSRNPIPYSSSSSSKFFLFYFIHTKM
jgi:hypothetical protein